jgi:hypothetical protein
MNEPFIRWYSTRYNIKPTQLEQDRLYPLWLWASQNRRKAYEVVNKVKNKYARDK